MKGNYCRFVLLIFSLIRIIFDGIVIKENVILKEIIILNERIGTLLRKGIYIFKDRDIRFFYKI